MFWIKVEKNILTTEAICSPPARGGVDAFLGRGGGSDVQDDKGDAGMGDMGMGM